MSKGHSNPAAAIVAIGNELTTGAITDTNSSYLAGKLGQAGFRVRRIVLVEDVQEKIVAELRSVARDADLIITTGGLGPTSDDLTREAVAEACGVSVVHNEDSLARMKKLFELRGRPFAPINERQAFFPEGAEVLPNPSGTADAFITDIKVESRSVPIISVPGVPREMKDIYATEILPRLEKRFPSALRESFSHLRLFGLSESYIGGVIESVGIDSRVSVAYRPTFPEILLSFRAGGVDGVKLVESAREAARNALGAEYVISDEPDNTLPNRVLQLLVDSGKTIAAAESCTGGMLTEKLISNPGASRAVLAGVVSYSNEAKQVFLGVKPLVLADYGAVSREVAEQMAEHVRVRSGASIGVSITGIAGPDGGTETKPVGTVWVALSIASSAENDLAMSEAGRGIKTFTQVYRAERNQFRTYVASYALDLVRRYLLGYPLEYVRR